MNLNSYEMDASKVKKTYLTEKEKSLFIASGILFLVGVIICVSVFIFSLGEGKSLFSQTQNEEGNYVFTYDFSGEEIKKISIDVSVSDVNIIGGAQSNYIELINFAQQDFKFSSGATTLSISEKSGLGEIFSFNFSGLRNLLHSVNFIGKDKKINVYLTSDAQLKYFCTEVVCGDITFENCSADTEYEIKLSFGNVLAENMITKKPFSVYISEGNFDLVSGEINSLSAQLLRGYVNIDKTRITETNAEIKKGYFKYLTGDYSLLSSVMRIQTDNGRVRFNNDIYENGKFSQGIKYSGISSVVQIMVNVHVSEGNIMITE